MSRAVEAVLGERIASGLVIVKDGHAETGGAPLHHIALREAAHPVPDSRSVGATAELLFLVDSAGAHRSGHLSNIRWWLGLTYSTCSGYCA